MKIAVASKGKEPTSEVDPRFGRARYFLIYDTEEDKYTVLDNMDNVNAMQGAGVQTAQRIAAAQVQMVVSGNIGPKAFVVFRAAGIKAALWAEGTVAEAVELVKTDKLKPTEDANVRGHWQ